MSSAQRSPIIMVVMFGLTVVSSGITEAGELALDDWRHRLVTALEPQFGGLDAEDVAALRRTVALLRERLAAPTRGAAASGARIRAAASPTTGTGPTSTT